MKQKWILYAAIWAAALIFLSAGLVTLAAITLLLAGIVLPGWLLLAAGLVRLGYDRGDARVYAAVAAVVLVVPVYLLRKLIPGPAPVADLVLVAAAWGAATKAGLARAWVRDARTLLNAGEGLWIGAVLPVCFSLTWLGFAVKTATDVRYLGLFFVDFNNLVSVQNVVRVSEFLPTSPVAYSGPLSYHWLYFALPAWGSEFLGLPGDGASTLVVTNLLVASILYVALARICRGLLREAGLPTARAAHLCGVALFGMSTLYAYQQVAGRVHFDWLTLGTRNHLLLQLPHSFTCFGNNTLALTMSLLVVDSLARWCATANPRMLLVAATLASLLPGYSITIVFAVALAVTIWSLSGRMRRPAVTLVTFAAFATLALGIFRALGLFSYGHDGGGIVVAFDRGQFMRNVTLGFLPVTVAAFLCWRKCRVRALFPFICVMLGCLAVPTLLMTKGSPSATVDFSMKIASLYLVTSVPTVVIAGAWLLANRGRHPALASAAAVLICIGLVNSASYFAQHAVQRARGRASANNALPLDHYSALQFVAQQRPSQLVLLDHFGIPHQISDPAVSIGAKRVLVASGYHETTFPPRGDARRNKDLWLAWQQSGFTNEVLALRLAERADVLIGNALLQSPSWTPIARFGEVGVFRSTKR